MLPLFLYLLEREGDRTYVGCSRHPLDKARRAAERGQWRLCLVVGPIDHETDALAWRDEWRQAPAAPRSAGWSLARRYGLQLYCEPVWSPREKRHTARIYRSITPTGSRCMR